MTYQQTNRLQDYCSSLVDTIRENGGNRPIVLFDTAAVIDFEKKIRESRLKDKQSDSATFYNHLGHFLHHCFVPHGISKEIEKHTHCKVSGIPEISAPCKFVMDTLNFNFSSLMNRTDLGNLDPEKLRYDVWCASLLAFRDSGQYGTIKNKTLRKKSISDPISGPDRELVSSGLLFALSKPHFPVDTVEETLPSTGVVIVSPDIHVRETVKVLTDCHPNVEELYGYRGLKTISSEQ